MHGATVLWCPEYNSSMLTSCSHLRESGLGRKFLTATGVFSRIIASNPSSNFFKMLSKQKIPHPEDSNSNPPVVKLKPSCLKTYKLFVKHCVKIETTSEVVHP